MNLFSAIPFLRILVPFVSGILLALCFHLPEMQLWYLLPLLALTAAFTFYSPVKKWAVVLADLFLLMYGIGLVQLKDLSNDARFYGKYIQADSLTSFMAVIQDVPVEKDKTIKCDLKVFQIRANGSYIPVTGNVIAYFRKPVTEGVLMPGNTFLIRSKLQEAPLPLNPFEFDYKAYLQNKQVYHTAFVDSGAFEILPPHPALNAAWKTGLLCKSVILGRLKHSGLSRDAYTICSALLTGYDDEIDRTVLEAFSHSGTLHVLSVSGLHTGLIYLVLGFLFDLFDRRRRYKLLKFGFITFILWGFALITGFSAPVLRAVIMFNLFGLGSIYFRNDARNQFNILLVSAFVLLCYNPFYLADVGFLLSYFALAGLIFFQPKLSELWQPRSRISSYVWQSVTASVAATLSTLPLTLFYFKQFPIWFFVCNLVVVPATFIMLFLAALVVLKLGIAATICNWLTTLLIGFIQLFNSGRFGFIDYIQFDMADLICLSVLIILASAAFQQRSYRLTLSALLLLIGWQFLSLTGSFTVKQQKLLAVYHLKNASAAAIKNKDRLQLSVIDPANYNFHVKPHVASLNYPERVTQRFNYIKSGSNSVLLLTAPGCWPSLDVAQVSTLILANDFKITEADLRRFVQLKTIVSDGSNNARSIKQTEELCCKFGVGFYSTKRKGAYLLTL